MPHTVVIADDVTGANDIGIMYAKAGWNTLIYRYGDGERKNYAPCDVLIVDTDSRFDTAETAYRKVFRSLKAIPARGVRQYIDKQCSVFRGNIGAEFDAMLDALHEDFAVVVLGFPDNGRTTLHGRHYVYGTLLENSQFRHDPVHPMTRSDLTEILRGQTERPVGAVYYEAYDRGEAEVRRRLEVLRKTGGYCVMDVRDNRDLEFLAGILKNEKILCGSSALSEYLARIEPGPKGKSARERPESREEKTLCVAGSLTPQTVGQIAYIRSRKRPVFELDTRKLFDPRPRAEEFARLRGLLERAYRSGGFALIHSMNEPERVEQTKKMAEARGIGNTAVSEMVSGALSGIARSVIEEFGIRNIIVCGGDTSAALCGRLGIEGMRVLEEIEPGLPTCQSVDEPYYKLVLKSGSFGKPEFLAEAVRKLNGRKCPGPAETA